MLINGFFVFARRKPHSLLFCSHCSVFNCLLFDPRVTISSELFNNTDTRYKTFFVVWENKINEVGGPNFFFDNERGKLSKNHKLPAQQSFLVCIFEDFNADKNLNKLHRKSYERGGGFVGNWGGFFIKSLLLIEEFALRFSNIRIDQPKSKNFCNKRRKQQKRKTKKQEDDRVTY